MKDLLMIPVDALSCVFYIPRMIMLSLLMDADEFAKLQDAKLTDEYNELCANATSEEKRATYEIFTNEYEDFIEL